MRNLKIQQLSKYIHWLEKAKYEVDLYKKTSSVFDLANIFLSLNALPEWIEKSDDAPEPLKRLATEKILIMRGVAFELDETKLNELDHQLRFIRTFCNHSKHGDPKDKLPQITMGSEPFPLTFPIKFDHIRVGSTEIKALPILESVIHYWELEIQNPTP